MTGSMLVRCKYCRCILLSAEIPLVHGIASEKHGDLIETDVLTASKPDCSHFFTDEAPSWFITEESKDGKIACPSCKKKVGTFSWMGSPCACGQWIVPAFAFLRSRTDPLRVD